MRRSPKDEAEFCEVSSVMAVLIEQLLLSLLEQLDGLLALLLQVLNEDLEVLIRVQQVQLVLQVMHLKSSISFQIKRAIYVFVESCQMPRPLLCCATLGDVILSK